jgi:Fic family protein
VTSKGRITRREAVALTGLSDKQVKYRLSSLVKNGLLQISGHGRGAYYQLPKLGKNGE